VKVLTLLWSLSVELGHLYEIKIKFSLGGKHSEVRKYLIAKKNKSTFQ
jgi:hypothetical protein